MFKQIFYEDSRQQLISKSRNSEKGRQRLNRRNKSKVANTVQQYNSIDMNKLFKDNILTININVNGETNDYIVKISFGGFLDILHSELSRNNDLLDLRLIVRALVTGFNRDNVYISCTCPDFFYRFGYFCTRNQVNSGPDQKIPSNITNPDDKLGSACKHVLLVLSNTKWLMKVASVINNYIKYMQEHYENLYADIIYPAIYQKEYKEPTQQTIFDTDELETDTELIDRSNAAGKVRGQFKPGNEYRFQPTEKPDKNQQTIFDINNN